MDIKTVRQFSKLCNCSYEAIRQRVEGGSIATIAKDPTIIDADKHRDLIQLIRTRATFLQKPK